MPLQKVKPGSNMYQGWVTHTHAHLGGECPHGCSYCYVNKVRRRQGPAGRYSGPLCLIEKELEVNYGSGKTIFIDHMNDLWAEQVPGWMLAKVLGHCRKYPQNTYVFQTKNPSQYVLQSGNLPPSCLLGCTIESDRYHECMGSAPRPSTRAVSMGMCREFLVRKTFVTIEPILDFDLDGLLYLLSRCRPSFINIGADSKGHGLPEPSADKVIGLMRGIKKLGFDVEIKRKSNLQRILGSDYHADGSDPRGKGVPAGQGADAVRPGQSG